MATLTNTKIKDTYKSLLKVSDNGNLEASLQEITDGEGNASGVQLNTGGDLTASGTVAFGSLKDSGENITITKFVDEADGIASNDNDTSIPTSAAVKNYVDTKVTAEDLDFAGDSGTGSVDLDSQTFTISGTANEVVTSASGQTLTIGLPSTVGITTALGVGTSSPIENVQITDSSNVTLRLTNTTDSTASLILQNTGSDNLLLEQVGGATLFKHGSTERMRIDSSGNLGIGTSSPASILDLGSNSNTSQEISISGGRVTYGYDSAKGASGAVVIQGSANKEIHFETTADSADMVIDSSGRVGIGTSSPASKLESYIVTTGAIGARANANIALSSNGAVDTRSIMIFGKQGVGGYAPAYFGFITTDGTGESKGDIIFGTRSVTTDSGPTERMRIDSSGYLRLAGAGIQFNGDTAAANALDDYEEGTWSPVYEPQTGSFATMTMDVLDATYTKIGRLVHINVNLRTDDVDVTGASGNVFIGGLPFTSRDSSGNGGGISVGYSAAFVDPPTAGGFVNNGTSILLRKGTSPLTISDLTDGTTADRNTLYLSATYITS